MPPRTPLATYRIQLTAAFGFTQAAKLVPYLKALGITHLYVSPFMRARSGSTHGYDVIDHNKINDELGGESGFAELNDALARADVGLILDFVPNHVGIGHGVNAWWLDVLEWGRNSPHARSFDIDWDASRYRAPGAVLLPILGKPYGEALEGGEIELRFDPAQGSFSAWYFDHRLPICPVHYGEIIERVVENAGAREEPAGRELLDFAVRHGSGKSVTRERAEKLKAALRDNPGSVDLISRGLAAFRVHKENPAATEALHGLLERQHYRVAH